jgi:hypothetical protein
VSDGDAAVERFRAISGRLLTTAEAESGVQPLEPDLAALTDLMRSSADVRPSLVQELLRLIDPRDATDLPLYTPGVVEIFEFSMHDLRWPEVGAALEELKVHPDPRVQRQAERVLRAFDDDWPTGEIYGAYRAG